MIVPRNARRSGVRLILALFLPLVAGGGLVSTRAPGQTRAGESPEDRIAALRRQGRYAEAATLAGQDLAAIRANEKTRPYQILSSEWRVKILERAAAAPDSQRLELAWADSARNEAQHCIDQGRFADGILLAQRAISIEQRVLGQEHPDVAEALNDLGALLKGKGDYAAADTTYRAALAMSRRIYGEEHPEIAKTLSNLAILRYVRGDVRSAESLIREALALNNTLADSMDPVLPTITGNLAVVLQAESKYTEAESVYREAIAQYRRIAGETGPTLGVFLNNLGTLCMTRGDYDAAEPLMREALSSQRTILGEDHPSIATCMNNLATLLARKGDMVASEALFVSTLALLHKVLGAEHPAIASCLDNYAVVLRETGNKSEAESVLREVLSMQRRLLGEGHPEMARAMNNLAIIMEDEGRFAAAESLYRESAESSRPLLADGNPMAVYSMGNVAGVLQSQGNCAAAEPLYRDCIEKLRGLLGNEHPDLVRKEIGLGSALWCLGRSQEAKQILEDAATGYEAARLRSGQGMDRATFQASSYPLLAAVDLDLGLGDEAWRATEHDLSRVLFDVLAAAKSRPLSDREQAREDSLLKALGLHERQMNAFLQKAPADTTGEMRKRAQESRSRLLEAEAKWSTLQRDLTLKYPMTQGKPYPPERIQASLLPNQALVGWLEVEVKKGEHISWGYVVRQSGPVAWARLDQGHFAGTDPSLTSSSDSFRRLLTSPDLSQDEVAKAARDMWTRCMRPLDPHLEGVTELIVVPSGPISGVPLEALLDATGRYAGTRFTISYAPSATLYTYLRERSDRRPTRSADQGGGFARGPALLVGDPPFTITQLQEMDREGEAPHWSLAVLDSITYRSAVGGNEEALSHLPRLPGSRAEVLAISLLATSPKLLLGPAASEQEVDRLTESGELRSYSVLHFATHALVDLKRPERSCIVLSRANLPDPLVAAEKGQRIFDGRVTVKEILQNWSLDADLVTLSGCETGSGKQIRGEGTVGFAHAFLQVGARSLLVSLWGVEDSATALLMQRFYQSWWGHRADAGQVSKATALQQAKEWLRTYRDAGGETPYAHPFYWSGFILIGDRD
jgi:CHAT domain-containing protein/tetratricopeptide (TPR) repeat protein